MHDEERAKFRAWGFVDASDPQEHDAIAALDAALSLFYREQAGPSGYWASAEKANVVWDPVHHPFHCHLASLIPAGSTVVDFGCGSGHVARNLAPGVKYTGIDVSANQIEANRKVMPDHRFISGSILADHQLAGTADWAVSLFTIEHCTRPDVLLRRMVETCKPGGHVAVLCPNSVYGMNSLRSGRTALTKRDKLRRRMVVDALLSYAEERWLWPRRLQAIHASSMAFPIYLRPRCLEAPYFSDNDAVYLTSETRIVTLLKSIGCRIDYLTDAVSRVDDKEVIYVVATTPGGQTS